MGPTWRSSALDHVQLAAPPDSEDAARAFYGGVLGLAELAKPHPLHVCGGVWFACGAETLHVGIEDPFIPARKAHPALRTTPAGLDAVAARLEAAGHPVRWTSEIPQLRRFHTDDPFGNRLELLASPVS